MVSCHGKPEGGRGGREEVCGGGIEPRLSDIAGRSPARQPPSSPLVSSAWENRCIKCPRKEGVGRVLQNRKSIITLRWSHVRERVHGDSLVLTVMQRASRSVGLGEREGGRKKGVGKEEACKLPPLPPSLPPALIVRLCLRLPVPEGGSLARTLSRTPRPPADPTLLLLHCTLKRKLHDRVTSKPQGRDRARAATLR